MGQNYLTKYKCPTCYATCDTETQAEYHCYREIDEVYECELCGYETNDNTEAELDCSYHK